MESAQYDKLQERNQQVLSNISQLQTQEKELYDSLNNVSLSPEEKQLTINKINELSQMRVSIYSGLKDLYASYQTNVSSSQNTLQQSMAAISVLEDELNQSKAKMNLLDEQTSNQLRMVEINTYYGKQYDAHARIMKLLILLCLPLLLLTLLANKGIIPSQVYGFVTGIVIIVGGIIIGYQLIDISNRDNMNWDEYEWYFNKNDAPSTTLDASALAANNPWSTPTVTCVGAACCDSFSTYDGDRNICVANASLGSSTNPESSANATSNANASNSKETFTVLTKYSKFPMKLNNLTNKVQPSKMKFNKKKD